MPGCQADLSTASVHLNCSLELSACPLACMHASDWHRTAESSVACDREEETATVAATWCVAGGLEQVEKRVFFGIAAF